MKSPSNTIAGFDVLAFGWLDGHGSQSQTLETICSSKTETLRD